MPPSFIETRAAIKLAVQLLLKAFGEKIPKNKCNPYPKISSLA
jgi:hypothetical protein